ncbi:cupin domain-containing protein [Desulfovibrio subterraneus]|jgi:quercetin dioxygenase-like cupin family protein|uniref:cupin domain-containing protein n=1 Tax=Desulfovibrio subterraneus TaxID=2718620 RepID=UPI0022B85CDE|nr:cupin domain-containing protein [Desulfovibrio subterraneus]WBF67120.1 cupin domain-containing protein [Desulfovibrio subterraneus]
MLNNPFLNSHIALADADICCSEVSWNAHPAFTGVALRHMVTSGHTQGRFSIHLVRVDPGCVLETHNHPDNWEFHSVVSGSARCELDGRITEYAAGVCGVMPQGVAHKVVAGDDGVFILATFVPALL